jgi:hypothetical protein
LSLPEWVVESLAILVQRNFESGERERESRALVLISNSLVDFMKVNAIKGLARTGCQ